MKELSALLAKRFFHTHRRFPADHVILHVFFVCYRFVLDQSSHPIGSEVRVSFPQGEIRPLALACWILKNDPPCVLNMTHKYELTYSCACFVLAMFEWNLYRESFQQNKKKVKSFKLKNVLIQQFYIHLEGIYHNTYIKINFHESNYFVPISHN